MEIPGNAVRQPDTGYETNFASGMGLEWVHLRNPMEGSCRTMERGLVLKGNMHTLSDIANPAFLGFRQRDLSNRVELDLSFKPGRNYEEAGISVYYKCDAHLDLCVTRKGGADCLLFRKVVGEINHEAACLPVCGDKVTIRIIADKLEYKFYAVVDEAAVYLGRALTRYVSTEAHELGFTGVFYALYATGNGAECRAEALFSRFSYQGFDREDIGNNT
jgi:alpha-N-arabinofuranosidase